MKRVKQVIKAARGLAGVGLLLAMLLVGVSPVLAQSFGLTKSVAAGGGSASQTGGYGLTAVIGQPAAAPLTDSGGQYNLSGGILGGSEEATGSKTHVFLPVILRE